MADTQAYATAYSTLDVIDGLWGPYWSGIDTAVIVFIDANEDVLYLRTNDKGATWAATSIYAGSIRRLACWYDKETIGNVGNIVHISWLDAAGTDAAYYRTLDVVSETLGTERTVDNTLLVNSTDANNRLALTVTKSGNIILAFSTQNEFAAYKSDDGGATWDAIADVFEAATSEDHVLLYPANTADDDDDAAAIFWDRSANEISIKMLDQSAASGVGTWTETSIATTMVDDQTWIQMDGAVRHSDQHIILAAHSDADTTGDDLLTWDLTVDSIASPTVTAKPNIFTNQAQAAQCAVLINQQNDFVYVSYLKGGNWTTTVDVVFHLSDDNLATWEAESAYSEAAADDNRRVQGGRTIGTSGGRIQWAFFNDDLNDLFVNEVNDIEIEAVEGDHAISFGFVF